MNELTIFDGTSKIAPTGNARLDELNGKIADTMRPMGDIFKAAQEAREAFYKASAPFFGEVKRDKLFEKAGYKSFEAYAWDTFHIKRSMAYMVANVGIQFFLVDNDYTRKARETFTVSNLAELLKADRVAIAAGIDSGELDSTTAQEDLRKFEDKHLTHKEAAKRKEKVVPTFDVYDMPRKQGDKPIITNVIKDDFLTDVVGQFGHLDVLDEFQISPVKLDGDKPSNKQHFIVYGVSGGMTGFVQMYEYSPHVKVSTGGKGKRPTFADIIKSMSPEDLDLLRSMVERGKPVEDDDGSDSDFDLQQDIWDHDGI